MSWRKWLVRSLVFGIVVCCVVAGLLYHRFTDPGMVRQQIVDKLQTQFPAAVVTLDAARLHLLGGIVLTELRLVRRDDPDKTDLVYVPYAIVHHDKEHLHSKIALRKIEFHRPRVHLVRSREGHWNLEGLFCADSHDTGPMPILVIRQGTLVFDDRQAAPNILPLEINDVNLTVVNDPLARVVVEGTGTSETLGEVCIHGTWQRDTKEIEVTIQAKGLPLVKRLVQRLGCYCPESLTTGLEVEGHAEVKTVFHYQPISPRPWNYDAHFQVSKGQLRHPQLPLPLDNLEMAVRCLNGVTTLEYLQATSGGATVQAHGVAQMPRFDQDFQGTLIVDQLLLCPNLFEKLPVSLQCLNTKFQPNGQALVKFEGECRGGQWVKNFWTLQPKKVNLSFLDFPYLVDQVTGNLTYDCLTQLAEVNLKGLTAERLITLKGTWKNFGKEADVNLNLEAREIPLDEKLLKAFVSPDLQQLARSFHATGKADIKATFQHSPGAEAFYNSYHAHVYDANTKWAVFPYPLEKVSCWLDLYPTHWTCRDFQGSHNGGTMRAKGWSVPLKPDQPPTASQRIIAEVTGENVNLGPDLKKALHDVVPGVAKTWDMLAPTGRINFGARIDQTPGQGQDLNVALDVRGCALTPQCFPLDFHDVCCYLRYHKNQLVIKNLTARHQRTLLSLDEGVVDLGTNGSYRAEFKKLIGNPIQPDADLAAALPKGMREAWASLKLAEPFAMETKLVIAQTPESGAQPVVWWDGKVWLHRATVNLGVEVNEATGCIGCQGLYDGYQLKGVNGNVLLGKVLVFNQPFHDVQVDFQVPWKDDPSEMHLGLHAPIFGGDVTGEGMIRFSSRRLGYELNLTASQIQLTELSHHNLGADHQLSGIGAARLHLKGQSDGINTLEGNGSVDVPYSPLTKLYNLPLLLDLLKFLNLRWPDRTAFEEAHATFNVQGKRLTINRLDLLGSATSLWGQGAVNLDGTDIQMDFYPSWGRVEQMLPLPSMIRTMPSEISKNLLKIEMRGKVGSNPEDVQFRKLLVPGLTEPLLNMSNSVFGKGTEK